MAPPPDTGFPRVLRFDDRKPAGRRLSLLWPAWQWQVIVPLRSRDLDLIQRAVLGLLAARWRTADQLALALALDPGVVDLVLERLHVDRVLAATGVTPEGMRRLSDEGRGERDGERATAFVYGDPFRGVLWRHAAADRPSEYDVVDRSGDTALLAGARGERGGEWHDIVQPPSEDEPARPEAIDVLQAIRASMPDWGSADSALVSIPHEVPPRVYLRVFVYPASHGFADRPWEVTNPFGVGLLPGMHATVELAARGDAGLARKISETLQLGRSRRPGHDDWDGAASVRGESLNDLLAAHADIDRQLVDLEAEHVRSRQRKLQRRIRDADRLSEAVASCAASTLALTVDGRHTVPWLDSDRSNRAEALRRLAGWLGFDAELPASASSATRAEVDAALNGEGGSLRALVLAGMFSAHAHGEHALNAVVARSPDLPAVLLRLAEEREGRLRIPVDEADRIRLVEHRLAAVHRGLRVLTPLLHELRRSADEEHEAAPLTTEGVVA
jgi:hypothetical protein